MSIRHIHQEVALNYGGVSEKEQEGVIRLDRHDREAHISSTWAEWSQRLERLYGPPTRTSKGQDGRIVCAFWIVPLTAIRVGRPRRGRPLTEEERQAAADRLQKARLSRVRTA